MDYNDAQAGLKLKDKIILVLNQNYNLSMDLNNVIANVLGQMISFGFPIDESILKKLEELTIVRKPKYADRTKKFNVEDNELFVPIQMLYEDSGTDVAVEMILNYLFPNLNAKTEALYQNMVQGLSNTFSGESNMSDGFRVNELMSLIVGCDLEKGIQSHPLFMSFCQGNMSVCLDKIQQKLVSNGLEPKEAKKKVDDLLSLIDYNNKIGKKGFLREAQRKLTELFLLTNPSQEQIITYSEQVIKSTDAYSTPEERLAHQDIIGFDVEYNKMIEDYYLSIKLGNTK